MRVTASTKLDTNCEPEKQHHHFLFQNGLGKAALGIFLIGIVAFVALRISGLRQETHWTGSEENPATNWENGVIAQPQPEAKPWELNYFSEGC